jgi:transposase InsO family protein
LVITEYLSKFAYAVPIKSKTAKEIARHLWHYFCLVGPCAILSSDMGSEFLNSTIDEMLVLMGTERRHTSSYHPQTNGLTEKYNGTLCSAVRKNAESNRRNWDLYLDHCLYSYRRMIQKTTKHSPFDLFYGRRVPDFKNFKIDKSSADEASLIRRSAQIQEHQEKNFA